MKRCYFYIISIILIIIANSCDIYDPDYGVDWQVVQLTDTRVSGIWYDYRTYDEYGSGSYGESGYYYELTINSNGSYNQRSQSYKKYGGKTTYGSYFDSPVTINKLEYTDSNIIGNKGLRVNSTYEYMWSYSNK